jgi:hypothetical protein
VDTAASALPHDTMPAVGGRSATGGKMAMAGRLAGLARSRASQLVLATVAGAAVGLFVFAITRTGGRSLFVVSGAAAGLATAAVLQLYGQTVRLTEVKVTVPQLSELTFVVNNDGRKVAWQLFVEAVTRISTQPLDEESGLLREAMTSLHALFGSTREILRAGRPTAVVPGGQTVEHLAVVMLNRELRPFLSKWHPRLRRFEEESPGAAESAWPDNRQCRSELQQVQRNVQVYAVGFARLAGVRDAQQMIEGIPVDLR